MHETEKVFQVAVCLKKKKKTSVWSLALCEVEYSDVYFLPHHKGDPF